MSSSFFPILVKTKSLLDVTSNYFKMRPGDKRGCAGEWGVKPARGSPLFVLVLAVWVSLG